MCRKCQSPWVFRASVTWLRVGRPASPFGVAYTLHARSLATAPVGNISLPSTVMVGEPANSVSVVSEAELSCRICTRRSLRPRILRAASRRSWVSAVLGHSSMWSSSILMSSLSTAGSSTSGQVRTTLTGGFLSALIAELVPEGADVWMRRHQDLSSTGSPAPCRPARWLCSSPSASACITPTKALASDQPTLSAPRRPVPPRLGTSRSTTPPKA